MGREFVTLLRPQCPLILGIVLVGEMRVFTEFYGAAYLSPVKARE